VLDVVLTFDGGRALAVVEDGQLAEDLARRQNAQKFALARNLNFAL
jgi:hypothetical protein